MNRLNWIRKSLFTITLLFTGNASAINLNIDFEDVDSEDVDILVGEFSTLVKAFEAFVTDENSILEVRIDQVFSKFDQTLTCAMDQLMVKSKNTVEGSLPNFAFFRGQASKACESATLKGFGVGGTLDRVIYDHCVLREYIRSKPVAMGAVSSGYSGLKEIANAAYCQFRSSSNSEEYLRSKEVYSNASILVSVYADISRLKNCDLSNPKALYKCSKQYYQSQLEHLNNFSPNDLAHVDYEHLKYLKDSIAPPSSTKKWWFWDKQYLSADQLTQYERLIASARRYVELARLSQRRRSELYNKSVPSNAELIRTISAKLRQSNEKLGEKYLECGGRSGPYCFKLKWTEFSKLISPVDSAINSCQVIVTDRRFNDLINATDKTICTTVSRKLRKRISNILDYFTRKNEEQARAAQMQDWIDRAPK